MYFFTVCRNSYSFWRWIKCNIRVSPYHKTCCIDALNIVSFTIPLLVIAHSLLASKRTINFLSSNASVDVLPTLSDARGNSLKFSFLACHLEWCFACQGNSIHCADFLFDWKFMCFTQSLRNSHCHAIVDQPQYHRCWYILIHFLAIQNKMAIITFTK